jgi:hypothetical protein
LTRFPQKPVFAPIMVHPVLACHPERSRGTLRLALAPPSVERTLLSAASEAARWPGRFYTKTKYSSGYKSSSPDSSITREPSFRTQRTNPASPLPASSDNPRNLMFPGRARLQLYPDPSCICHPERSRGTLRFSQAGCLILFSRTLRKRVGGRCPMSRAFRDMGFPPPASSVSFSPSRSIRPIFPTRASLAETTCYSQL